MHYSNAYQSIISKSRTTPQPWIFASKCSYTLNYLSPLPRQIQSPGPTQLPRHYIRVAESLESLAWGCLWQLKLRAFRAGPEIV